MLYTCENENFRGQASRAEILFHMLITWLGSYYIYKENTYAVFDYGGIVFYLLKFISIKMCLKQFMFIVKLQNYRNT